jgi:excalibur calcium-binding domain-containing protein
MPHKVMCLLVAAVAALMVLAVSASAARETISARWKNCTVVNKRFPHGVGKRFAHDRTKSGDPVTNFRRSTLIYLRAMRYNRGLDRDKDGIACEKH